MGWGREEVAQVWAMRNVDESSRFALRRRYSFRIVQVVGIVVAVAGALVLVINACYSPASHVRESARLDGIEAFDDRGQKLTVHFIDVRQGDATLIETDDKAILVDGGPRSANVGGYLQGVGIQDIDLVVATHPDADHVGGLIDVLVQYPIQEIWGNGDTSTSQTYQDFSAGVMAEGATYRDVTGGYTAQMDGLDIAVLHPAAQLTGDANEDSLVLRLTCGTVDILLTGDATSDSEASMLADMELLSDVEVLKVGHHGSRYSTSDAFLDVVSPDDAVISVGVANTYGHPHQETLNRLGTRGVTVYRTDEDATIVLTSDCSTYWLATKTP